MAAQILDENLPPSWSCAVTSDGRVFFINDETCYTTWLHPVSQVPVQTGHKPQADLPQGWEKGITTDGIPYYINHNQQQTSIAHPITGNWEAGPTQQYPNANQQRPENITGNPTVLSIEHRKQGSKRSNVGSWVKGPCLRKPDPASVKLKGWLHKQGQDGLQFWKKRWFVLSAYCLYYYKGPEEDKVLGYLPLPSFRIRPSGPDDKVFKRFVFKVEHPNTRSYFFAADTKEQMTDWMNKMSLASILEGDTSLNGQSSKSVQHSNRPVLPSPTCSNSPVAPSPDDSDSGFDGYRNRRVRPSEAPPNNFHHNRSFNQLDDSPLEEISPYGRTKSDRLNTSIDSYLTSHPNNRQPFYANAPPKPKRLNTSYECSTSDPSSSRATPSSFIDQNTSQNGLVTPLLYPDERRTPEAYGATSTLDRTDYEDIYGEQEVLSHKKHKRRDSLSSLLSSDRQLLAELNAQNLQNNLDLDTGYRRNPIQRPHSADFLEHKRFYDSTEMSATNGMSDTLALHHPDLRSKSSVGYYDGDFWSEENYAAKMRQSAIHHSYLQAGNRQKYNSRFGKENQPQPTGPRVPPAGSATPDIFVGRTQEKSSHAEVQNNSRDGFQYYKPEVKKKFSHDVEDERGFTRSASARIPRHTRREDSLNASCADDGSDGDKRTQQREESMKRLLEWKQKMLQSPLTRKSSSRPESSASSNSSFSRRDIPADLSAMARARNPKSYARFKQQVTPGYSNDRGPSSLPNEERTNSRHLDGTHQPKRRDMRDNSAYEIRKHEPAKTTYSCSSEEDQPIETRESRRKYRKSPKKSSQSSKTTDLKSDAAASSAPDYVNIDSLPSANGCSNGHRSQIEDSLRAEPIYIDEDGECKSRNVHSVLSQDSQQSYVTEPYFAKRDPYYVSDVQMPSKVEQVKRPSLGREDFLNPSSYEAEYENTCFRHNVTSQYADGTPLNEVQERNYNAQKKHARDDSSSGKCSDSGYDTLRHERSNYGENDYRNLLNGSSYTESNDSFRKYSNRKSDSWGPERFENARSPHDMSSRLDESEVVREYSYEYITPEVNEAKNKKNLSNLSLSLKLSTPNLASLESPKMVQETQCSSSSQLVRDRVQSFSSLGDINDTLKCEDDNFRRPLSPVIPHQAKVSSLKTDFPQPASPHHDKEPSQTTSKLYSDSIAQSLQNAQINPETKYNQSEIRRFVFNESEEEPTEESPQIEEHPKSASVKELLRSFEKGTEPPPKSKTARRSLINEFDKDTPFTKSPYACGLEGEDQMLLPEESLPPPPPSMLNVESASSEEPSVIPPPRPPKKFRDKIIQDPSAFDQPVPTRDGPDPPVANCEASWYESENDSACGKSEYPMELSEIPLMEDGPPKEPAPPPPKPASEASTTGSKLSLAEIEQTYLPMSTPKKPFPLGATPAMASSSNSSLSSKHHATPEPNNPSNEFGNIEMEEHTYIEMPGDNSKQSSLSDKFGAHIPNLDLSRLENDQLGCPESPRYYEIGEKDGQLYEYISKGGHYESIYMEVPGSNGIGKEDKKPEIPKKPRHLRNNPVKCASDSALFSTHRKRSDSSSDEESNDNGFGHIDPPLKPRFSLSDTFRPASYYLSGADPAIDPDAHDSSDSDLVSPPPIPMNSVAISETTNLDPKLHYKSDLATINETANYVQFDGSDTNISKQMDYLDYSNSPMPMPNHQRSDSISSTMSDKNKRRPITDGLCMDIENEDSFILRSEDVYPSAGSFHESDLSSHPSKTSLWSSRKLSQHDSDVSLLADEVQNCSLRSGSALSLPMPYRSRSASLQSHHRYSDDQSAEQKSSPNLNISNNSLLGIGVSNSPMPRVSQITPEPILDKEQIPLVCNSNSDMRNIPCYDYGPNTSESSSSQRRSLLNLCSNNAEAVEASITSQVTPTNGGHVRSSSNVSVNSETSPRTAPYYYSDVIKSNTAIPIEEPLSISRVRSHQLNNQRDFEANKRQDIGRKVNLISPEQRFQSRQETSSAELKNSLDYFDAKTICVPDDRNIYQSDTLRKMRARTPDPNNSSKNLYPYGISLKTDDNPAPIICHRRTRSLEGMIDDVPARWNPPSQVVTEQPKTQPERSRHMDQTKSSTDNALNSHRSATHSYGATGHLDDSQVSSSPLVQNEDSHKQSSYGNEWEDDGQWREQLRRASLRHTRSLEALDEPTRRMESTAPVLNRDSKPFQEHREVSPKSLDEYLVDYREGRVSSPPQQACHERSERNRQGLTTLDEYEWDAIEERFCKPPSQYRNLNLSSDEQSFLSEGLPPPITRVPETITTDPGSMPPLTEVTSTTMVASNFSKEERGLLEQTNQTQSLSSNEKLIWDDSHISKPYPKALVSKPDVIPKQDVVKFGEVLPKRADFCVSNQASSETNSNYGFGSTYQNISRYQQQYHPNVNTHNSFSQYKTDEMNEYNLQQNLYPYNEERYYDHTYQNFRNEYDSYANGNAKFDNQKESTYRSTAEYPDYYNQYQNTDSSPYDYHDESYLKTDLGYDAFSESESTLSRKATLDGRSQAPADLYEPQKLLGGVSAGELLGKTHEELVLLLIQLRRHQSALQAARRHTNLDKEAQTHRLEVDPDGQEEHLARIAYLEEHLLDLDKQYQMGKPLINLVDNMVKLGSLYQGSSYSNQSDKIYGTQDSLEFSRRMLEKRILAEDRVQLDSMAPDQINLEEKVMELYKLEKKLQEESMRIQHLQRKKDLLEGTLEDLNHYDHRDGNNLMEIDRVSQRNQLERELSSLRSHLAVSARRLEDTASENNRLEHEMMMLRQKIQTNMARNLHRNSLGTDESQHIENEMLRVQSLLEELQKRRMDLSQQIQRLTSNQNKEDLYGNSPTNSTTSINSRRKFSTWLETDLDQMVTKDRASDIPELLMKAKNYRSQYNNFNNYHSSNILNLGKDANINESDHLSKLKSSSISTLSNLEKYDPKYSADLLSRLKESTKTALNYGRDMDNSAYRLDEMGNATNIRSSAFNKPQRDAIGHSDTQESLSDHTHIDINDADDRTKRFYGIIPKEKPLEPRTVRVVKRESTERKRDRFPPSKKESGLTYVAEDEMESENSDTESSDPIPNYTSKTASLPRNYGRRGLDRMNMPKSTYAQNALARPNNLPLRSKPTNYKSKTDPESPRNIEDDPHFGAEDHEHCDESPIFKSAAAQEIVKEMGWQSDKHKRAVPKEKRRHFTISSSMPMTLEAGGSTEQVARSRDDCDMVRALRPRNHPDVVKSTLSTRDLRINETTIDNIFGAPSKISIPERYMGDDDDEPKLSVAEKLQRQEKARSIRKMLTESSTSVTKDERTDNGETDKAKIAAERKEREHILSMNQLLAKQVVEKSRLVAVATTPDLSS